MLDELARRALATVGALEGPVEILEAGLSSAAFLGTVDGTPLVVRVPKMDGLRPTPRYDLELRLLDELDRRGVPVATGRLVSVDGVRCAVATFCPHPPVTDWTDEFVVDLATAFATLHSLSPELAVESDIVARLHLARSWPFDGSNLDDHPIVEWGPSVVRSIRARHDEIIDAASQYMTVAHTDIHPKHLLQRPDGRLAAILDFGDAFGGSAAWDFAAMRYYFGDDITDRIVDAYPNGDELAELGDVLSLPWALYKLDKTPERAIVRERVNALLDC